jgi:sugar fermentation stimulation protein A
MRFQSPLVPARLLRRYKRFLADAVLEESGREVVAHCPNPGAMLGLAQVGARIWLEPNDDPKKKLKFGWRLEELQGDHMAGIDTSVPNKVVSEALKAGRIPEAGLIESVKAEVPYGRNSRVDFLCQSEGGKDVYIEVKNVHLRRDGDWAEFPDCVTKRGTKHLYELMEVVAQGKRAVMLYVVQRDDCARFRLAPDLDPEYAKAFDRARAAGVEMIAYGTKITRDAVILDALIPIDLRDQTW